MVRYPKRGYTHGKVPKGDLTRKLYRILEMSLPKEVREKKDIRLSLMTKAAIPTENKKNQGVFVKPYAPGGNKVQKAIFSIKVKGGKVTRSLTLVSCERASLVENVCQILSLYLLRFKSYSEG